MTLENETFQTETEPEEIFLLAFDDFEPLRWLRPTVTAIRQPVDEIAAEAWLLILSRMDERPVFFAPLRASTQLIIRQSTLAPAAVSREMEAP